MKQALFYEKLAGKKVKCQLCHQACQIDSGKRGLCGVRENQDGILSTLVYGKIVAANIDPIEKKPFYHFLPGSQSFSIATAGCNFNCANCQNADISQITKGGKNKKIPGEEMKPQQIVDYAVESECPSISYTYTEPTIFFEFALDCMKLAHEKNLKNVWVSNGYTKTKPLEMAKPYLDAVNIDLKFFNGNTYKKICGAELQPVLDNLVWYRNNDIWLEVTTLVIPGLNDSEKELTAIADFIKNKLGQDVPWHVSAFWPTYKLNDFPPTSQEMILQAVDIGKKIGLKNVYSGNI